MGCGGWGRGCPDISPNHVCMLCACVAVGLLAAHSCQTPRRVKGRWFHWHDWPFRRAGINPTPVRITPTTPPQKQTRGGGGGGGMRVDGGVPPLCFSGGRGVVGLILARVGLNLLPPPPNKKVEGESSGGGMQVDGGWGRPRLDLFCWGVWGSGWY